MKTHQDKLQVGVIFGGRSGEHEISLLSARSVISALNPDRYRVTQIGITHAGAWFVGENLIEAFEKGKELSGGYIPAMILADPTLRGLYVMRDSDSGQQLELLSDLNIIFPVLHGTFGEDGTLQGLLEMAGIAYVGAGVLGSSLGMDKGVFRDVMRMHGLPVVDTLVVLRREIEVSIDQVIEKAEALAPYPLFTKPANLGSSVGISKCKNRSDLLEGLMEAARFDRRVLVERGVPAREIEVSVLGNDEPSASIPGEIRPQAEFYSYDAKYHDDRTELLIPAPIPAETAERVRELAIKAYLAVDCAGMARVDFLMDKNTGELYLNEINTIPGFTQISMYPKLWEASGLPFARLVDRLIELALERRSDRDRTEWRYQRQP
ncbi:MAG TPA: D-alanine--D-alanine ligase family protein [Anaerolineales bacterium]|nr:D-alanine--D-alanine ligase family protein [Anaerolineales bacterium]